MPGVATVAGARGIAEGAAAPSVEAGCSFPASFLLHANGTEIAIANNPVSYTHLRAHAPVLDLVCRLLLEKKHT